MKIDLDFDIDTLRITDPGEDEYQAQSGTSSPSQIYNQIKQKSNIQSGDSDTAASGTAWQRGQPRAGVDPLAGISVAKPKATVESSKLRELINNIGNDDSL
jgi:hypothetical protein